MTDTQKKIKHLFDSGNEIVQDYTLYTTIVKGDPTIDNPEKIKFDLTKKYGSLGELVKQYSYQVRSFKF